MTSLESIFSSCKLDIALPDGSFDLPDLFASDGPAWLKQVRDEWKPRDVALFDERLQFLLTVTIPSSEPTSSTSIPTQFALFLSHLQISLEASYVSPSAPPSANQTPNSAVPPQNTGRLQPPPRITTSGRASPAHAGGLVALHPPMTPLPTPATGPSDAAYAHSRPMDGGTPVHSYIWGEVRSGEEGAHRAVTVFWDEEERQWTAVYRMDVAVAYVQTWFPNPLLCLTASATLRDKRLPSTALRAPLFAAIDNALSIEDTLSPPSPREMVDPVSPIEVRRSDAMDGFEEVNLLDGIAKGPSFGPDSNVYLPSTRLSDPFRRHAYSLRPIASASLPSSAISPASSSANSPSSSATAPLPVLRKSYRTVLPAVSAIRVRMRTTFVPYFVLPGTDPDDDEGRDAGNEEKTVILAVEVENVPESRRGFLVEQVEVSVGGEGAKARLIGWDDTKETFPLELKSKDMYNLLYAVSFLSVEGGMSAAWPSTNSLVGPGPKPSEGQRPMSIVITGRPFDPDVPSGESPPPVNSFPSRWSSILDLAANSAIPDPTVELSHGDTLPMPSSPFPTSGSTGATTMMGGGRTVSGSPKIAPESPIAGSKRHTFAGLAQRADRFGLGKKLLTATHRSSTPVPGTLHASLLSSPPPNSKKGAIPPPLHGLGTPPLSHLSIARPGSPVTAGPNTPAFPSYTSSDATIPSSPYSQSPISSLAGTTGPVVEPKRLKMANGALPPTPHSNSGSRFSHPIMPSNGARNPTEVLLVSISLIPPARGDKTQGEEDDDASSADERIFPLDTFALEIFVFNKSSVVRQCEISFPDRKRWRKEQRSSTGRDSKALHPAFDASAIAGIVPMENNINVGPLVPNSCQSVRMQFMALRPGVHTIDAITVRDLDSDNSTNLRSVMHVVVHETVEPSP